MCCVLVHITSGFEGLSCVLDANLASEAFGTSRGGQSANPLTTESVSRASTIGREPRQMVIPGIGAKKQPKGLLGTLQEDTAPIEWRGDEG